MKQLTQEEMKAHTEAVQKALPKDAVFVCVFAVDPNEPARIVGNLSAETARAFGRLLVALPKELSAHEMDYVEVKQHRRLGEC